jgi:hypothetical protein
MVDRHARTAAVAINDFLAGAGEGQVPPGRTVVAWENRHRLLWVGSSNSPAGLRT